MNSETPDFPPPVFVPEGNNAAVQSNNDYNDINQ